jgi:dGTPase
VLGAFTKYPRASEVEPGQAGGVSGKKFGFMQSEAGLFAEVAESLGLRRKSGTGDAWHRHPLAFLVEAADDICYHVMDIEDGFKTGFVSYEEIDLLHRPWLGPRRRERAQQIVDKGRRAEYFRAVTINEMVQEAVGVFDSNYDALMNASFDDELSARMPRAEQFKAFKDLAKKKVYTARPVVEIEACGFEVIGGLLTSFVEGIDSTARIPSIVKVRARTLIALMPLLQQPAAALSAYERVLVATDFVSGMTDSFAVELYQRIRGISLP